MQRERGKNGQELERGREERGGEREEGGKELELKNLFYKDCSLGSVKNLF